MINAKADMTEMNAKIDVLFGQISELEGEQLAKALHATNMWRCAKTSEFFGLGPMEVRGTYQDAYSILKSLGLEVGGMIAPYPSNND
jgi:hypothetical protein